MGLEGIVSKRLGSRYTALAEGALTSGLGSPGLQAEE
jgi:hypothetical protein